MQAQAFSYDLTTEYSEVIVTSSQELDDCDLQAFSHHLSKREVLVSQPPTGEVDGKKVLIEWQERPN